VKGNVQVIDQYLFYGFLTKKKNELNNVLKRQHNLDYTIVFFIPSPKICSEVMEKKDGVIEGMSKNKIWLEMSTTDDKEVKRLGELVKSKGAIPLDAPVSGGCHRATTGNIAIFVGGERKPFERILPVLTAMGREILHTGELGSASIL